MYLLISVIVSYYSLKVTRQIEDKSVLASNALAASSGMSWEGPMDQTRQSVSRSVGRAIGVDAIIGIGLGLTFGERGGGIFSSPDNHHLS